MTFNLGFVTIKINNSSLSLECIKRDMISVMQNMDKSIAHDTHLIQLLQANIKHWSSKSFNIIAKHEQDILALRKNIGKYEALKYELQKPFDDEFNDEF